MLFSYGFKLLSNILSFQLGTLFSISCRLGLVATNSFHFCLSGNILISPSFLKDSLPDTELLVNRFFFFQHFKYIIPLPSALQSSCWENCWQSYWGSLVQGCPLASLVFPFGTSFSYHSKYHPYEDDSQIRISYWYLTSEIHISVACWSSSPG